MSVVPIRTGGPGLIVTSPSLKTEYPSQVKMPTGLLRSIFIKFNSSPYGSINDQQYNALRDTVVEVDVTVVGLPVVNPAATAGMAPPPAGAGRLLVVAGADHGVRCWVFQAAPGDVDSHEGAATAGLELGGGPDHHGGCDGRCFRHVGSVGAIAVEDKPATFADAAHTGSNVVVVWYSGYWLPLWVSPANCCTGHVAGAPAAGRSEGARGALALERVGMYMGT
mmetsp:Transcript_17663/g.48785  ORF Transcript_17663/g.48785 Transcript_17663/m.48785 type:complete len:223 (+) Transcript_17663:615-1283(+)